MWGPPPLPNGARQNPPPYPPQNSSPYPQQNPPYPPSQQQYPPMAPQNSIDKMDKLPPMQMPPQQPQQNNSPPSAPLIDLTLFDPVPLAAEKQQQPSAMNYPPVSAMNYPPAPPANSNPYPPQQQPLPQRQPPPQQQQRSVYEPARATKIDVELVSFDYNDEKKRLYVFSLSVRGNVIHTFAGTFSNLQILFGGDRKGAFLCGALFPKGLSFYQSESSETNVAAVGKELQEYFYSLLNKGGEGEHLTDAAFLQAFGVDKSRDPFITTTLANIAEEKKVSVQSKKAAFTAETQYITQLRDHAKNFNNLYFCRNFPPNQLPSLTFAQPIEFSLRTFGHLGNKCLYGPRELLFFSFQRNELSGIVIATTIVDHTLSAGGNPLLLVKRENRIVSNREPIYLSRFDPRTNAFMHAATIDMSNSGHIVTTPQPAFQSAFRGGQLVASGYHLTNGMSFRVGNQELMSIYHSCQGMTKYHVSVAAGVDIVLALGVITALDRIFCGSGG